MIRIIFGICILILCLLIVGALSKLYEEAALIEMYVQAIERILNRLTEDSILDDIRTGKGLPPMPADGGIE